MRLLIYILVVLIVGLTTKNVESSSSTVPYFMYKASTSFNIDLGLLYAICTKESKCRPKALNKDDANQRGKDLGIIQHSYGLFQIKIDTARGLGFKGTRKDLMAPEVNTWYAAMLLRHLYIRYGQDTVKVISAYNAGKYTKTNKKYVDDVLANYIHYKIDKRLQ